MRNYSDKEFKELYSEIIDYVKSLTTKWDPSIADEADPGVAILKSQGLFYDKINYKINYRNAQNSVREVTDAVEGEQLFHDLGYQIKKKKSATGQIGLRYLKSAENGVIIPLFTQFSDSNNSITFTSIRKTVTLSPGETKLIEVQEGIPTRYEYLGRKVFTNDDLTSSLRLSLMGYDNVASNGVIICTVSSTDPEAHPSVSDWLNTGDNSFTAVETNNIFSIGRDSEGISYIQFYEESLKSLSKGVQIWILSSYGSAGNISANKLNTLYSTEISLDPSQFIFSQNAFTGGQDQESLVSARENYYKTFGVNESLVSSRDYSTVIESIIGPSLSRIISKALVSDVGGNHNLVQVLAKPENKEALYVRYWTSALVSGILVNALKYSNDYYESFKILEDDNTLNLIKKAIFKKNVISNEIKLVKENNTLYNKYIFDFVDIAGTVIVNSTDTEETLKDKVKRALAIAFNSANLTPGHLINETELAAVVRSEVQGVVDCSFYYKNHSLYTNLENKTAITDSQKNDLVARSVLRGDLPLFSEKKPLLPLGARKTSVTINGSPSLGIFEFPGPGEDKVIKRLSGMYDPENIDKLYRLNSNEFIQFYKVSQVDSQTYGFGVRPLLLAKQTILTEDTLYSTDNSPYLLSKGSKIVAGSTVYSNPGDLFEIEGVTYYGGISEELVVIVPEGGLTPSGRGQEYPGKYFWRYEIEEGADNPQYVYTAFRDYTISSYLVFIGGTNLKVGSVIHDGSYLGGKRHYALTLENGKLVDLTSSDYSGVQLWLKTGESSNDYDVIKAGSDITSFRVENFKEGLHSNGAEFQGQWGESLTSETIVTTTPDLTTLESSDNFKYGIISNHKFEEGEKEYILGEGEHFIYSDSDLIDFVDFGSGTRIRVEGPRVDLRFLTNTITLDQDLSSQLTDLTTTVYLENTEIYTFTKQIDHDVVIKYGQQEWGKGWKDIKKDSPITVTLSSGSEQVFDENYQVRIGLILKTDKKGLMKFSRGQELEISFIGSTSLIKFTEDCYLSSSELLYLNSATNTDLSETNLKLKLFNIGNASANRFNVNSEVTYNGAGDFIYTQTSEVSADGHFTFRTNSNSYLLKVKFTSDVPVGPVLRVERVILRDSTGGNTGNNEYWESLNPSEKIQIIDRFSNGEESILRPGEFGYFYIKAKPDSNSETYGIKFILEGNVIGNKVIIESQTQLEGFNPDLFFPNPLNSEESLMGSNDPSQKIELSQGEAILAKITELATSGGSDPLIQFDYGYVAESQIKSPTEAIKYYDEQHLLNKNILTVINLESLIKNLKIIRRIR